MSESLLVLRFRDLSVEPGQTIIRHRRVIAEHDRCWWGWWARSFEAVPAEMLAGLEFPREVVLYDTDQSQLYRASCTTAVISQTEQLSPRVDWTPNYYNNRRLRAWFLLEEIEEETQDLVIERRCLATANPTILPDWPITALADLRRSETTMWLLSEVKA